MMIFLTPCSARKMASLMAREHPKISARAEVLQEKEAAESSEAREEEKSMSDTVTCRHQPSWEEMGQ